MLASFVILNYDFFRHFDYKNEHTITVCHNILPKFMRVLLFWTQDSDTTDDFTQVPVMTEDTPPSMNSIAIILEGNIVMDEISTISQAFCLLFGLIYALHLDYPKGMKNTFELIQKILLKIWEIVPQERSLVAEGSASHSTFQYCRNHQFWERSALVG